MSLVLEESAKDNALAQKLCGCLWAMHRDLVSRFELVEVGYRSESDRLAVTVRHADGDKDVYELSVQALQIDGLMPAAMQDLAVWMSTVGGELDLVAELRGGHVWLWQRGLSTSGSFVFSVDDVALWIGSSVRLADPVAGVKIGVRDEFAVPERPKNPSERLVELRLEEESGSDLSVMWFQGLKVGTLANCGTSFMHERQARSLVSLLARRLPAGSLEVKNVTQTRSTAWGDPANGGGDGR